MSTDTDKSAKIQPLQDGNGSPEQELHSTMTNLASQIGEVERFIARRFDEISMEINATSQQIDMNEEETTRKFGEILQVLKAVSYHGDGSTAANAGVELDAVVETTEKAANRILDAAERISDRIKASQDAGSEEERQKVLENITDDIEEIFLACSFQDITGQRIRNTLENLREIEDRLGNALSQIGIEVDADVTQHAAIKDKLSTQSDIDDFFGSQKEAEGKSETASQDEIDDMF